MSRLIPSLLSAVLALSAYTAMAATDKAAPAPQVQSVNIQDVKPDASDAPGYT